MTEPAPPPPTRVCSRCSTVAETEGAFCPHCGAPYGRRRRGWRAWSRRRRRIVVAVVVVLVLAGVGTAVALKVAADRREDQRAQTEQRREAAAAAAKRAAAERRRAKAAADAAIERLQLRLRRDTVRELRSSITSDARKRVSEGVLDGPVRSTSCQSTDGADEDLTMKSGEFECMAVTEELSGGRQRGYRFSARVDFDDGSYTWRLGD